MRDNYFRMTEAKFLIECCGCGNSQAVLAEGLDQDLDLEEIADEVVQHFECKHCGVNTLRAYFVTPPTLH